MIIKQQMGSNNGIFQSIVALLRKTQGRDKLTKFLIYWFKLIDSIKSMYNKRPTYRYERIGSHFQRARQFMRLGKFISQYGAVIQLINQDTRDEFGRLVRIILHALFSFYWALDNLSLIASFGIFKIPEFRITQSAMTIKFFGMFVATLFNIRTWIRLHHAELCARIEMRHLQGQQNLQKSKQLKKLILQQWKMFLLCVKVFGDMLPTISKSAIARKIFQFEIPRIVQALGGLTNAFVSCLITTL